MNLVLDSRKDSPVSLDAVAEFEAAILRDGSTCVSPLKPNRYVSRATYLACRFADLAKYDIRRRSRLYRGQHIGLSARRELFTVLMGSQFQKCFPHFLLSGKKAIYLFDAWPSQHERIKRFVGYLGLNRVFVSSSQAAERLQAGLASPLFDWVPEGINPEEYRAYPPEMRDIDVLALGRKYDSYHVSIVSELAKRRKMYVYEKRKGEIIFPTREGFVDGLARSKISVCVPSSVTHPERSGDIETMTIRYLQSMVSKCLVVGYAPKEMIGLFGYNPVVEIDMENPVGQVCWILEHLIDFGDLIERNFSEVVTRHTWQYRWRQISHLIS